jgi:hypothetical protein
MMNDLYVCLLICVRRTSCAVTQLVLTRKSDAWSLIRCSKSIWHNLVSRAARLRCDARWRSRLAVILRLFFEVAEKNKVEHESREYCCLMPWGLPRFGGMSRASVPCYDLFFRHNDSRKSNKQLLVFPMSLHLLICAT